MSQIGTRMEKREPEEFERALVQAMRSVEAPEGFAERVMGCVGENAAGSIALVPESGPFGRLREGYGELAGSIARVPESGHGAPAPLPPPAPISSPSSPVPASAAGLGGRVVVMRSRFASFSLQAWVGGAIAAMLVLGLFAGEQVRVRHEREQAELATQQFETATRVTDHALEQVRAQLAQAGLRLQ